ncbi:MAG: LytTR family DNA-binding domain-containing protein [Lachnospiraceae bacterium]|nr:LytTR family DNA-binding domain-containing protein [Lachnospiraceae bacterium]
MYYIGICNDGKNTFSELEDMIVLYSKEKGIPIDLKIWNSGESLCESLEMECELDILFLEIELPTMNRIGIAQFIRNKIRGHSMEIIYISTNQNLDREMFKTQPLDFLVKPFTQSQISEDLDLAVKLLDKKKKRFEFKEGKDIYFISYDDIMCFASQGRKVLLVTKDKEYSFYGKLDEVKEELPGEFWCIHKSYIVNKAYVKKYAYESIELSNGEILSISRTKRKEIHEKMKHTVSF